MYLWNVSSRIIENTEDVPLIPALSDLSRQHPSFPQRPHHMIVILQHLHRCGILRRNINRHMPQPTPPHQRRPSYGIYLFHNGSELFGKELGSSLRGRMKPWRNVRGVRCPVRRGDRGFPSRCRGRGRGLPSDSAVIPRRMQRPWRKSGGYDEETVGV